MTTVTTVEAHNDLVSFIEKHSKKGDWNVITSPMENNSYHKVYVFEDGAVFTEVNEIIWESYTTMVHGVEVKGKVQLFRTEYWSTDDSKSKYCYQTL